MNLLLLGLPLLAAGALAIATPLSSLAPQGNGPENPLHSLRGRHGFHYDGVILGTGPVASSGPITFDGHGNLSASYTTTIGGVTFRGSFTGTYVVHADGSGAVTLTLPLLGLQAHGDFVLVDGGKGTFFSCTDGGFSITGATRAM
jgi:hypothetical protein